MVKISIEKRCRIHAEKMQEEGWYVTANVLSAAADEISILRGFPTHGPRPIISEVIYNNSKLKGIMIK